MNIGIERVFIICCLVLSAFCTAGHAEEEEKHPAASRYLAAYNSMEMGDWLAGRDMIDEAVDIYREALGMFRRLAEEYPEWQSELVSYRIAYCADQLRALDLPTPIADEESGHEGAVRAALRLERLPELTRALEIYSGILDQDPSHVQALKGAARCHLRMGSIDAARALLQKGITGPVSDSGLLVLMALVECHDQQFDRAIQLLRLAIEDNPMKAEAYVAMGVALAGLGRLDAASNEMKRALSLNTTINEAYYNLAWISLRQNPGNVALVRTHYNNALKYGAEPDPLLERLFR